MCQQDNNQVKIDLKEERHQCASCLDYFNEIELQEGICWQCIEIESEFMEY